MRQGDIAAIANSRIKRAELISSFGAGLLGFGLGMLAASYVADLAWYVLVAGVVMHGWGMYDKHVAERNLRQIEAPWVKALYWLCWLVLAGLAVVLIVRVIF